MGEGQGEEKPGGERLHPDAGRAHPGPRTPAVPPRHPATLHPSQRRAEFGSARAAESSWGSRGHGGSRAPVSSRPLPPPPPPPPHTCTPARRSRLPGPSFQVPLPLPGGPDPRTPGPARGTASHPRIPRLHVFTAGAPRGCAARFGKALGRWGEGCCPCCCFRFTKELTSGCVEGSESHPKSSRQGLSCSPVANSLSPKHSASEFAFPSGRLLGRVPRRVRAHAQRTPCLKRGSGARSGHQHM